jgi:hypothetical protein
MVLKQRFDKVDQWHGETTSETFDHFGRNVDDFVRVEVFGFSLG